MDVCVFVLSVLFVSGVLGISHNRILSRCLSLSLIQVS